MSDEAAHGRFLAKYRWMFLQVLKNLRPLDGGGELDDPEKLLDASRKLSILVKRELARTGQVDVESDLKMIELIAVKVVTEMGMKLLS